RPHRRASPTASLYRSVYSFFFQAEDGIRDRIVTGVQTCALPIFFVTNGSITESSTFGDNDHPAPVEHPLGASWELWKKLAAQDSDFGHPEKFCENIPDSNWTISATITFKDKRVAPYIENINHKDPYSGSIVTSGPTSIKDSNWLLGYSISRQPHFQVQKENELVVWLYALYTDREGNYIAKRPDECSGKELCEEW